MRNILRKWFHAETRSFAEDLTRLEEIQAERGIFRGRGLAPPAEPLPARWGEGMRNFTLVAFSLAISTTLARGNGSRTNSRHDGREGDVMNDDMHHQHAHHGQWIAAAHATLHCSIGCILGETAGLMLGTTFGF